MPTGYTAALYEGEDQSFPEFVMQCARAFGALITLRDSGDAPIPDEFEPHDYHANALAEATARLAEIRRWSLDDAEREASAAFDEAMQTHREMEEKRAAVRGRYAAMREQVEAWDAPTSDHVELRNFMLNQLDESIKFDCSPLKEWSPERQTAEEYLASQLAKATRAVQYHAEEQDKENERARERTEWVRALRGSLDQSVSA